MSVSSLTTVRLSRDEHKKARELEELRKSGAAPPELDAEGNMINPHIPQYISSRPWYLNQQAPGLKHQKASSFAKNDDSVVKASFTEHYQRGRPQPGQTPQATKFIPGSCTNCGATTHKTKDCCERPRKKGAALTGKDIMPDERIQNLEFSYDAKRDRWSGYDTKEYGKVIRRFEVTELERKKKKLQELDEAFELEKQEERRKKEEEERKLKEPTDGSTTSTDAAAAVSSATDSTTSSATTTAAAASVVPGEGLSATATDARRLRALRKQEKLKKMIKKAQKAASANNAATGGTSGAGDGRHPDSDSDSDSDASDSDDDDMKDLGEVIQKKDATARMTVRNLRIREDTAKYLRNLDLNSAHFDPKTRSMRDNPYEGKDPNDVIYAGDNFVRKQGETKEIQSLQSFVWESVERGNEGVHVQALPSQAEKLFADYRAKKEALAAARKTAIQEKYGSSEGQPQQPPRELLVPATESYVEYDETGALVKGVERAIPKTKYAEDVYENGHKTVWGSFYRTGGPGQPGQWGYDCCHQTIRHAICTGEAGKKARAEMDAQVAQRPSFKDAQAEKEKSATMPATTAPTNSHTPSTVTTTILTQPSTAASSTHDSSMKSSQATAMDTSHDVELQRQKRKRHSASSSSSSSDFSSSSDSDSDSSSSSDSGSDSDSDSDSGSDRHSKKSKSKAKQTKKAKKRPEKKKSKREPKDAKSISLTPQKTLSDYHMASDKPSDREMEEYYKLKSSRDDPLAQMPKDQLLQE